MGKPKWKPVDLREVVKMIKNEGKGQQGKTPMSQVFGNQKPTKK